MEKRTELYLEELKSILTILVRTHGILWEFRPKMVLHRRVKQLIKALEPTKQVTIKMGYFVNFSFVFDSILQTC